MSRRWYGEAEQSRHYREAAREAGCTCPDLPPHVHREECPRFPGSEDRSAAYGTEREGEREESTTPPSRAGDPLEVGEVLRNLGLTLEEAARLCREYLEHLEEEHRSDEELR